MSFGQGDSATVTEGATGAEASRAARPPVHPALVLVWAAGELERIGEVALLPPGAVGVLGRGPALPDDPGRRLQFIRQRPGGLLPAPPFGNPKISRVQLIVAADGEAAVRVRSVGRCPLLVGDRAADEATLRPGEVFRLGTQLAFFVTRRPGWLSPGRPPASTEHPFGAPDEHGLVGESPASWELRQRIAFVASVDEHVLVAGPTGGGKELVAAAIHRASAFGARPWVSRNAATFPDALIDAELFGHARNYPNAGMPERAGVVGLANDTTLFLDEFAELPHAAQAHLLRVLDSGEYQRLGEGVSRRSTFRLVAATNRPLASLKPDVAARLRLRVDVPGLEERREDLPLLFLHTLRELARQRRGGAERFFPHGDATAEPRVAPELIIDVVTRSFPSNLRDLQRLVWDAVAASPDDRLEGGPAGSSPTLRRSGDAAVPARATVTPDEAQAALDRHGGRLDLSWRELGLASRHALARLVAKHRLRAGRSWRAP
jgi:two-component system nitrogen regulation response regulator GlnG/two-component system response regulator HydG